MRNRILLTACILAALAKPGEAAAEQVGRYLEDMVRVRSELAGPTRREPKANLPLGVTATETTNPSWVAVQAKTGTIYVFRNDVELQGGARAELSCDPMGRGAVASAGRMGLGKGCP